MDIRIELEDDKFRWDNQSVLLLLSLYKKLKVQFKDPKITKRKLWKFIEQKFLKKNYVVTSHMLDKKFRNLKQTYLRVKNKQRYGGRVTWEYLEQFDNIFDDDDDIKPQIVLSSHKPTTSSSPLLKCNINPDSTIWLNSLENSESIIEESSQSEKFDEMNMDGNNTNNSTEDEYLKIEKTKVQKLSEIADSMKERNELLRKLIDVLQNNSN